MGNIFDTKEKIVKVVYTNWKGETKLRKIVPENIWFGQTEWHTEKQWLLKAFDVEKQAKRDFAMKEIRSWFVEDKDES